MQDYYLNDTNCINRLVREYQEHQSLVIAYDFDNTIYDYHNQGHVYNNVIELLLELKKLNCYLIVFTASEKIDFIKKYLNENKIPYDAINKNPPFFKSESGKIYYNILLDDRAGLSAAFHQLNQFISIIKN